MRTESRLCQSVRVAWMERMDKVSLICKIFGGTGGQCVGDQMEGRAWITR